MSGTALRRRAAMFRARVEAKGAANGLAYPWWISIFSTLGQTGFVIVAAAQRDVLVRPSLAWVPLALVIAPHVSKVLVPAWVPGWLVSVFVLTGISWLLVGFPVLQNAIVPLDGIHDTAVAVLAIVIAEVAATDGPRTGLGVTLVAIAAVLAAGAGGRGLVVHVVELLFGFVVGGMLSWQMRALAAERTARSGERDRATLAERQRIAREIHDLVGHSLSVTLLHVTGARRALQQDRNVDEAVAALTDAERVGRDAMADIRRSVGVLATTGGSTRPLPTATDIDQLVADLRSAGVEIAYRVTGDVGAIPAATGLGIYRVAQESLANVTKHAPDSPARVLLEAGSDSARLRVSNPLPAHTRTGGEGAGVTGMTARAEQLSGSLLAGPVGSRWLVDLIVPVPTRLTEPTTYRVPEGDGAR